MTPIDEVSEALPSGPQNEQNNAANVNHLRSATINNENTNNSMPFAGGPGMNYYRSKPAPLVSPLMSYSSRKYLADMATLTVYDLINRINISAGKISSIEYWQNFINDAFSSTAIFKYSKRSESDFRQFDFLAPLVPIIFVSLGKLGVVRIEMILQQLKSQVLSNGTIFFNSPRATISYHYPDGSYITHFVQLKGMFNSQFKIEWSDLCMHSFVPGIEWNSFERLISDEKASYEIFQKLTANRGRKRSRSKITKSNEKGTNELEDTNVTHEFPPNFDAITKLRSYFSVFRNVSVFGTQEGLMRIMQVSTFMSSLRDLKVFQKINGIKSPLEALNAFVSMNIPSINKPNDNGPSNISGNKLPQDPNVQTQKENPNTCLLYTSRCV